MNKIKVLVTAVIGLMILNLILLGLIFSHGPLPDGPQDHEAGDDGPKHLIIEKLGLNDVQQHQYDSLIQIHQASLNTIENDIALKKAELYRNLQGPDEHIRDSVIHQLSFDFGRIERTHYDHFIALRNICRHDQLNKFNGLTSELQEIFAPEE